jgi:transposase
MRRLRAATKKSAHRYAVARYARLRERIALENTAFRQMRRHAVQFVIADHACFMQ